jgi:hypothetical protein
MPCVRRETGSGSGSFAVESAISATYAPPPPMT